MKQTQYIHNLIQEDIGFFRFLVDFNQSVSDYADDSYWTPELKKVATALKDSTSFKRKLSEHLLKEVGLEGSMHYHFSEPRVRLALLDRKSLEMLIMYAAAGLGHEWMKKVIRKDDVAQLKSIFGEEIYFFACKEASLLKGVMPKQIIEGKFDHAYWFEMGKNYLEYALADEPEAVTGRVKLKFPKTMKWSFLERPEGPSRSAAWNYLQMLIKRKIRTERVQLCFA